jgi:hypothetical protein
MTQQVGSASGTAPATRENEVTPGGASELTSQSLTEGGASGGAPRVAAAVAANGADGRAARVRGWLRRTPPAATDVAPIAPSVVAAGPELDLASNDPLISYLLSAASAVDITRLEMLSPALDALQRAGVVLVVPLISSGSLVGLLSLGPRRSERGYSSDDLRLLSVSGSTRN